MCACVALHMFGLHFLAHPDDPIKCLQREAQARVMADYIAEVVRMACTYCPYYSYYARVVCSGIVVVSCLASSSSSSNSSSRSSSSSSRCCHRNRGRRHLSLYCLFAPTMHLHGVICISIVCLC